VNQQLASSTVMVAVLLSSLLSCMFNTGSRSGVDPFFQGPIANKLHTSLHKSLHIYYHFINTGVSQQLLYTSGFKEAPGEN